MGEGPARITQPMLDVVQALYGASDCELHGWAIVKTTKRAGPTVYKILERLTDAGWLTARWEQHSPDLNKPRRRLYRLTPSGAQRAHALLSRHRPTRGATEASPV
jgi:DNA-binding PadR family transcriptional regulator